MLQGIPAIHGSVSSPMTKREGMNTFLKSLNVTFRRDQETGRARINKEKSQMDKKQKESTNNNSQENYAIYGKYTC